MCKTMLKWLRVAWTHPWVCACVGVVLITFVPVVLGLWSGLGEDHGLKKCLPNYKTLWDKPNWYLLPVFWIWIFPFVWFCGPGFGRAWRSAPEPDHGRKYKPLCAPGRRARRWATVPSLLLALGIGVTDYTHRAPPEVLDAVRYERCAVLVRISTANEVDFTYLDEIATRTAGRGVRFSRLGETNTKEVWLWIVAALYCFQGLMIFAVFYAWFLLLGNIATFAWPKRWAGKQYATALDPESPLYEFGLEEWNRHLNFLYWWMSPILLIGFLSRSQQERGSPDFGQMVISICSALLVLAPMLLTIWTRQRMVARLWPRVRGMKDAERELFHRQAMWPIDRNWAQKLGLLLAMLLGSYLVGLNVATLAP